MLYDLIKIASLFALCGISTAAAVTQKRDTTSGVVLYAYGEDSDGAAVFYDNGERCWRLRVLNY